MNKIDLIECHNRIKPFIHDTPIIKSTLINEMTGSDMYFKCDNFQKMGAFKMRGATNAILQLSEEEKRKGVVTHSSGNFAQALSLAASSIGVKAYIVMPSTATEIKKTAVKGYKGELIECEPNLKAREIAASEIVRVKGATFIHPSNDDNVILGQGTACKELIESHNDLEYVLAPVGGGGLIAGSALAAKYFGNNCKIIGAEPYEADDAYRSLISGKIETNVTTNTIADGLKTQLGDKNFPIIKEEVHSIIRITEQEIIESMKIIWERLKIVCEPSCSLPLAAVLKNKEFFKDKKVGIIISGGNVDLNNLPF
jgi:threonine dehydratase